ncbi:hypothetical protein NC651_015546 [Populus alba x Populus x berolinensis]|nr:hypothetical protein NC651_015546 [Populus alba x Populus x berolinensis]
MNYAAWFGDSNSVSLTGSGHMGGGSSQGSGWTWVDKPISRGRSSNPAKRAAQEALPQAPAPAEVAHPIPNQEVAALRRELHGLINPKGGSVVSKGRVKRVQARRNYFL